MKKQTVKDNNLKNPITFQAVASNRKHLFFKLEPHLLKVNHFHESLEIVYLIKGEAELNLISSSFKLTPGTFCIINPNQSHYYKSLTKEISAYVIVLGISYTHHLREFCPNFSFNNILDDPIKNKEIIQSILRWYNDTKEDFILNCAYANNLFYNIINNYGLYKDKHDSVNTHYVEIVKYINEHYKENITLKKMAEDFGYTREYFSKLFHKTIGLHFNDYLSQVRIKHVVDLISNKQESKQKITDIIFSCGFNNLVTFYRQYKKYKEVDFEQIIEGL